LIQKRQKQTLFLQEVNEAKLHSKERRKGNKQNMWNISNVHEKKRKEPLDGNFLH